VNLKDDGHKDDYWNGETVVLVKQIWLNS